MKKFVFVLLAFSLSLSAQESVLDSLEIQNLEEVIVSSVRVKDNIPIAFNNVSKEEISTKVKEVVQEVDAKSMQDIGKVMGRLKSSLAGSADMGLVSKVVKDQLS